MAQSDESPRENISRNIPKHIYRENVAAATAASECGTAKLERIMMLMKDELCPKLVPLSFDPPEILQNLGLRRRKAFGYKWLAIRYYFYT